MGAPVEIVITDLLVKQVASLIATGASAHEAQEQLGMSRYAVKKVMASELFKTTVKQIGDEAVNNAKQIIRTKTGTLAAKVMDVLSNRLEKDDLEAVKVALKIMGFDQQEVAKGDTHFTIQLPGQKAEHEIPNEPVIRVNAEDAKEDGIG